MLILVFVGLLSLLVTVDASIISISQSSSATVAYSGKCGGATGILFIRDGKEETASPYICYNATFEANSAALHNGSTGGIIWEIATIKNTLQGLGALVQLIGGGGGKEESSETNGGSGSGLNDSLLYFKGTAINVSTGHVVWTNLEAGNECRGSYYPWQPLQWTNRYLLVACFVDMQFYVDAVFLNNGSSSWRWVQERWGYSETGSLFVSSGEEKSMTTATLPVVVNGTLYCLDTSSGKVLMKSDVRQASNTTFTGEYIGLETARFLQIILARVGSSTLVAYNKSAAEQGVAQILWVKQNFTAPKSTILPLKSGLLLTLKGPQGETPSLVALSQRTGKVKNTFPQQFLGEKFLAEREGEVRMLYCQRTNFAWTQTSQVTASLQLYEDGSLRSHQLIDTSSKKWVQLVADESSAALIAPSTALSSSASITVFVNSTTAENVTLPSSAGSGEPSSFGLASSAFWFELLVEGVSLFRLRY